MTPMILFENKCIHCWRAIELDFSDQIKNAKIMSPEEIIEKCVVAQKKLLSGFKGHNNINQKKFKESQDPNQFAISLFGEPTLYKEIGKFIENLRKKGKTSFLVTNGLNPDVISKMEKNNQLPTQLYVSVNSPNKELYDKFHRSIKKDAWKKLNKTLEIFKKIKNKTRTVIRINLVRGLNIEDKYIKEYASLIKKANPKFIEIKGYISVGFARQRLGYDKMPNHKEILDFSKKLVSELKKLRLDMKILDQKKESKVVVLGKDKKELKIKKSEI